MKHTPGPWEIRKLRSPEYYPDYGLDIFTMTDGETDVCSVCNWGTTEHDDVMIANAKLIAAAPDMLKALQSCLQGVKELNGEFQDGWETTIKEAEEAIAKATE